MIGTKHQNQSGWLETLNLLQSYEHAEKTCSGSDPRELRRNPRWHRPRFSYSMQRSYRLMPCHPSLKKLLHNDISTLEPPPGIYTSDDDL